MPQSSESVIRYRRTVAAVVSSWLLVIAMVAVGCASPGTSSGPSQGLLLKIDFRAPRDDAVTLSRLAGTVDVADETIVRVSCYNVRNWLSDVTLNDTVNLSTNPGLTRAAELIASGYGSKLVTAVENEYWKTGSLDYGPQLQAQGFTAQEVATYLEKRNQTPSETAMQRFVVFIAPETTQLQSAFYLDMGRLPWKATSSGVSTHPVRLSIDGFPRQVDVEDDSCDHS